MTEREEASMTPAEMLSKWKNKIVPEWRTAFLAAFVIGLLVHLPVLVMDVPNHDGLASMYFDQNMITSGRWFLTVACGFSSYYTVPWVIGLLGLFWLAFTAVALTELLEIKDKLIITLISGLLVVFPAIASTFAYVFTMDGYMMALFLAVLAVLLTKKFKYGFVAGAFCLAFSMGTYQAYLPFAILLSIYSILVVAMDDGKTKAKVKTGLNYLYMGAMGVALYYLILQVLLKLQGKELASYQGISGMNAGAEGKSFMEMILPMYTDFVSFTLKGNVLFQNVFSATALVVLVVLTVWVLLKLICERKWWKSPLFFVIIILLAVGIPFATNIILLVSPDVTYHLLMRYQWILYPILMIAFVNRYGCTTGGTDANEKVPKEQKDGKHALTAWGICLAAFVLLFCYVLTDNIGYTNLQRRYEKTYAYCIRLLDRIEQTEGYYQGMPIAIVGVVGYVPYPETDITGDVTSGMIGISGDHLLYTGTNYEEFMKHYLGATLNFLSAEETADIYYSEEYIAMESFPGETSVQIIDGVLCVKTENTGRD